MAYPIKPHGVDASGMAPNPVLIAVLLALASPLSINIAMAGDDSPIEAAPVEVQATSLGEDSDEPVKPAATLNGRELSLKRESTMGELLKSIPGISASGFGPAASRPVVRGLDGERTRIMQNGVGVLDASALSPDHAVALDPIVIEQIDVVRGPAALRYGGNAVGGAINAIDHRIPQDQLDGMLGRGEVRYGGADTQRNAAAVLDAGNGLLAIHADAYGREANDLSIPGYAKIPSLRLATDQKGKLQNSDSHGSGGALGASVTLDNGYAGISYSTFDNNYGSPAESAVRIQQNSDRWDFASEFKDLGNIINRVKLRSAYTDYQHQEIEGGVLGTTFKNNGLESSLELGHANIGRMSGMVGYQNQNSTFEALGDEAFVPKSKTLSNTLYIYEELPVDLLRASDLKLSAGARVEKTSQDSQGGGKFGAALSRDFRPQSYSFGATYSLTPNWSLNSNLSHSERAPSYSELYANGPHVATGQFEIGDNTLDKERSNGIDTQLRWKASKDSFSIGAFYNRFSNYITLANTGRLVDENGNLGGTLQESQITSAPAIFKGLEGEAKFRVYEQIGALDLKLRGDYIRATNRDTGDPLPRIAPMHLGAGLDYQFNRFGAMLDVLHGFKQDRTAVNETSTDGYTQVNATATYLIPAQFHLEAFAKATNLLDQTIREHSSVLKDIAPLGGRSVLIGLRGEF